MEEHNALYVNQQIIYEQNKKTKIHSNKSACPLKPTFLQAISTALLKQTFFRPEVF